MDVAKWSPREIHAFGVMFTQSIGLVIGSLPIWPWHSQCCLNSSPFSATKFVFMNIVPHGVSDWWRVGVRMNLICLVICATILFWTRHLQNLGLPSLSFTLHGWQVATLLASTAFSLSLTCGSFFLLAGRDVAYGIVGCFGGLSSLCLWLFVSNARP